MVFMPPGSAKSTYSSVRFPPYYLGKLGKKSIICASYGGDLATSFGRKVRNLVDSDVCRAVFPDLVLSEDQKARGEWETKDGGSYFAVGVGGGVTGRRADLGLIDDPVKGRKEADSQLTKEDTWQWYNSDFLTRLKPGAAQVIIQTRWTEDDLSGRILPSDWAGESGVFRGRDGNDWTVICVQAEAEVDKNDPLNRKPGEWLWPEWFTPEYWAVLKQSQMIADVRNWSSLYQQRPTTEDGIFFKREWFRRYEVGTEPKRLNTYGAGDYAVTADGGDFTEMGIGGLCPDGNLWMLDWWSGQTDSLVWIENQIDLMLKHRPENWYAESGVIRRSIEPFLVRRMDERRCYTVLDWLPTTGDKPAMAQSFRGFASQGKVYIPKTQWGNDLIDQLLRFPAGKFDDKVDVCGLFGRALHIIWSLSPAKPADTKKVDRWNKAFECDDADDWKTV